MAVRSTTIPCELRLADHARVPSQGWLDADVVNVVVGTPKKVPRGVRHRYMVVDADRRVAAMARQMRADLQE